MKADRCMVFILKLTNAIGTHKASLTHEVIAAAASYEVRRK